MTRRTYDERIAELREKQARELAIKSAKERLKPVVSLLNDGDIEGALSAIEAAMKDLGSALPRQTSEELQRQFAAATGLPVVAPLKSVKS